MIFLLSKVLVVAALVAAVLSAFGLSLLGLTPLQEAAIGVGLLAVAMLV